MGPLILVTGRDGQLGRALARSLAPLGRIVAWGRLEADFLAPDGIAPRLDALGPDVIANAAAWTGVDLAETRPGPARLANAEAPARLAAWAARRGALLVHFSTDYVFDGAKDGPYGETDPPAPLNAYGRTKLLGDQAVLASGGPHLVLRTSWVYSLTGQNFPRTILRLAQTRPELTVNDDQIGAPTSASFLAAATALAVRDFLSGRATGPGLYNLVPAGQTSWLGYARHLLDRALALGLPFPSGLPALRPSYGPDPQRPALRPLNSRLSTEKIRRTLDIHCPPWQQDVELFLRDLLALGLAH